MNKESVNISSVKDKRRIEKNRKIELVKVKRSILGLYSYWFFEFSYIL